MKKISIRTAQNILIDFRVAPLAHRVLAFFIDLSLIAISTIIVAIPLLQIHDNLFYVLPVIFIFYTPVSEILMNGQTLGKRIMRTRVVNVNGKEPTVLDFLIRWAFRLIDIYSTLGSLAVIFVSTTARGQRLGGVLSNTLVVSLNSEMQLTLHDILRIEDRTNYKPQYAEVYRFSEEEMLTVKSLIVRHNKYHNASHHHLVEVAAQRIAQVLGIDSIPENKSEFLKTVLRDYIVITRS